MRSRIGLSSVKVLALLLAAMLTCSVAGCSKAETAQGDIVSQKETADGRTPITVLVKYAFTINEFEKRVEEHFPDIDLVQVGNYTHDMGIDEYAARMEHGDLPDIVMTWPLDVGAEYWKDRLIDLSGMQFTNRYQLSMLNTISKDGALYYLPGPAQIRGIVYNKTLFKENGWQVPSDFDGFVELCKTIETSGMRSLQLGLGNSEVLDTAFIGYNYANFFSTPGDMQWIAEYNEGRGSFGEHFAPALDVFQQMIDAGIWKQSDLDITYSEREQMLFTRQSAMVEDSVLMARMGFDYTGSTDEFALMPFFNPAQESDWARLYMVCYIGANKELEKPENKKKYDLVMKLLDYISTVEGQQNLAADTGGMFSSLTDASPPNVPEIIDLVPALGHGRYAIFPQLANAQGALRSGLADMLRGTATARDVITKVDAQNLTPPVVERPKVLGTATADFTMIDTGSYLCDAMRQHSGSEVALFMDNGKDGRYNGKGISGRLYSGDVTNVDIGRVLPDLKHNEEGVLWKIEMTGADLLTTLEYAIPVDNNATGWFYYFSGLKMVYDPLKEPGTRITSITTADDKPIDPAKLYSIAVMDMTVPDEFIKSCEKTTDTISSIFENAVATAKTISPPTDKRFVVPAQ